MWDAERVRIEENKAIVCRWLDLVSWHDVDALCAATAPSWRMHGGPPGLPPGHAGIRALFRLLDQVDQHWTVDDAIAEGDRVAVRATSRWVQASFLGVPGCGPVQTFTATLVFQVVDGRVAATWCSADGLGRLLRLAPAMAVC